MSMSRVERKNRIPEQSKVYACPHCGEPKADERAVRVHINAKTDDAHRGSGFEDDVEIEELEAQPEWVDIEALHRVFRERTRNVTHIKHQTMVEKFADIPEMSRSLIGWFIREEGLGEKVKYFSPSHIPETWDDLTEIQKNALLARSFYPKGGKSNFWLRDRDWTLSEDDSVYIKTWQDYKWVFSMPGFGAPFTAEEPEEEDTSIEVEAVETEDDEESAESPRPRLSPLVIEKGEEDDEPRGLGALFENVTESEARETPRESEEMPEGVTVEEELRGGAQTAQALSDEVGELANPEETAYKLYDDLIAAIEKSDAEFSVERERLVSVLRGIREEEAELSEEAEPDEGEASETLGTLEEDVDELFELFSMCATVEDLHDLRSQMRRERADSNRELRERYTSLVDSVERVSEHLDEMADETPSASEFQKLMKSHEQLERAVNGYTKESNETFNTIMETVEGVCERLDAIDGRGSPVERVESSEGVVALEDVEELETVLKALQTLGEHELAGKLLRRAVE